MQDEVPVEFLANDDLKDFATRFQHFKEDVLHTFTGVFEEVIVLMVEIGFVPIVFMCVISIFFIVEIRKIIVK